MSRIGKRKIQILDGVIVSKPSNKLIIKGPLGELSNVFSDLIEIKIENNEITTTRKNEQKQTKQLHGTTNALIFNMINGVKNGFSKQIEIKGVGYKATLQDRKIIINAGYSHVVEVPVIEGVEVIIEKPTELTIKGIDKQKVGQMAALIVDVRRPSVYSGKGIMYKGQKINRKEGKKSSK